MNVQSAVTWLKIASIILIGFGLLCAISAHPSLNFLTRFFTAIALWPFGEVSASIDMETRLLWAILGGSATGWGLMFWLLTTQLFHKDPDTLRPIMLKAVIAWFVIDSTASIMSGAAFNAVLNLSMLALFVIPLWKPITVNKEHNPISAPNLPKTTPRLSA